MNNLLNEYKTTSPISAIPIISIISIIVILTFSFMVSQQFNHKRMYIFCLWIWIATFLYYFDYISFSPLYLSFCALIFTLYLQLIHYTTVHSFLFKFSIIIFEIFIFVINFYKHFYIIHALYTSLRLLQ